MKLIAVTNNSYSIQFIKDPTYEMKLIAVEKNPDVIEFISNPSEELCLIAVRKDIKLLTDIKDKKMRERIKNLILEEKLGKEINLSGKETCSVCLEEMDKCVKTKCNHHFHKKCMIHIINKGVKICPLCRSSLNW